ncbi:bone morphogenetic protein 4-like [Corticium candelabrum]|uniref:bone morphogenetic protein 4-like n=1 Tax=Corticium candelabrum TaxID=121492 RepID=UPI002E263D57|nr:bone morphogenetic protein 4-like [Corticium candelabrum]
MTPAGTWRLLVLLSFLYVDSIASAIPISSLNREEIERHLSLLNLYEIHNRTFNMIPSKPPVYLRQLYRKLNKNDENGRLSQMRCYLGHGLPATERDPEHARFYFNTTAENRISPNDIARAELRLKFQQSKMGRDMTGSRADVWVHVVRKPATEKRRAKLKLLNKTSISTSTTSQSYITLDVTHLARTHLSRRRPNLMIHVSIRGHSRRARVKLPSAELTKKDPDAKPLFIVYLRSDTDSRQQSREMRKKIKSKALVSTLTNSALEQETSRTRERRGYPRGSHFSRKSGPYCGLNELNIKFRDVDWTFVIAPDYYQANWCAGECPRSLTDNFNPTVHAILQSLFHWLVNGEVSKPCCVPDELESLNMLFYDHSDVILYKKYHGMRATKCGCH